MIHHADILGWCLESQRSRGTLGSSGPQGPREHCENVHVGFTSFLFSGCACKHSIPNMIELMIRCYAEAYPPCPSPPPSCPLLQVRVIDTGCGVGEMREHFPLPNFSWDILSKWLTFNNTRWGNGNWYLHNEENNSIYIWVPKNYYHSILILNIIRPLHRTDINQHTGPRIMCTHVKYNNKTI